MAQLLIMKKDLGRHSKGDIVEIRATSTPFGGKEPDAFILIEFPSPMIDFEHCSKTWDLDIGYEIVNSDISIDGFRIKVFSKLTNATGVGNVTKKAVEQFINLWGGSIHSFAENEVVFDILIFDAIKSTAFWEIPLDDVIFTELNYEKSTGTHQVEVDYSARQNNPSYVERYVSRKGATIINHANRIITFDILRSTMRQAFEVDINRKARKMLIRRRYHVSSNVVDYIIGQGGMISTDTETVMTYIKDKAAE